MFEQNKIATVVSSETRMTNPLLSAEHNELCAYISETEYTLMT